MICKIIAMYSSPIFNLCYLIKNNNYKSFQYINTFCHKNIADYIQKKSVLYVFVRCLPLTNLGKSKYNFPSSCCNNEYWRSSELIILWTCGKLRADANNRNSSSYFMRREREWGLVFIAPYFMTIIHDLMPLLSLLAAVFVNSNFADSVLFFALVNGITLSCYRNGLYSSCDTILMEIY